MKLKINPKFQALLPALSPDELAALRESIGRDGCRDAIVTWRGTIIDGHNRYAICTDMGVAFNTVEKQFDDEEAAMDWIDRNQLARRNLPPEAFKLALGRRYNRTKKDHGGARKASGQNVHLKTAATIAAEYGVDERTVRRAGKFAEEFAKLEATKPVLAREILDGKKRFKDVKREERAEAIALQKKAIEEGEAVAPSGVFDVVVIDPPWAYGREYDPAGSRVANPYPEMSQSQLLALTPPFADDCVLFLWTTHAFLWDAKQLADKWGFTYKATIVWDKQKIGMGFWLRMQCEFCLLCVKGKPVWRNTTQRDIITEPRREHSRKPDAFYTMVDAITTGKKLDYFSREKRAGWEVFGNDTDRF